MLEELTLVSDGIGQAADSYLLFNRTSKAFYGSVTYHEPHGFDERYFIVEIVSGFNIDTDTVVGSWPDFKVVKADELGHYVTEETVDILTSTAITKTYSIPHQINNLSKAILAIADKVGGNDLDDVIELREQVSHIDLILRSGNVRKQGYASDESFDYRSNADLAEEERQKFAGGLNEIVGPRRIV